MDKCKQILCSLNDAEEIIVLPVNDEEDSDEEKKPKKKAKKDSEEDEDEDEDETSHDSEDEEKPKKKPKKKDEDDEDEDEETSNDSNPYLLRRKTTGSNSLADNFIDSQDEAAIVALLRDISFLLTSKSLWEDKNKKFRATLDKMKVAEANKLITNLSAVQDFLKKKV